MKALVTGYRGFIGSHLANYLEDLGYGVVSVDIADSRYQDIRQHGNVAAAVALSEPDIIFHLAAVSRTPWAVEDPIYTYETNVVGSANVLEAARVCGVKKVVLASSNIVYAAQTPYRTSKRAMEQVARDYNDLYDLPTLCLRFSNVYGVGQHEDNVLASLSKSYKNDGYITITGDGSQTRNFTHVDDICRALVVASESDLRGTEVDITHPRKWSLNEIAEFFPCEVRYTKERKGDIKHLEMEGPDKAKELLGFEVEENLEDYIEQLYVK